MGKQKSKLPAKTQQHIRMNFLCQAANLMAALSKPIPPPTKISSNHQPLPNRNQLIWQQDPQGYHALSRYYNTTMKKIGQRMVLRLDPQLKRSICKRCSTSLIPAMTSTIRIHSRPETATVTSCNICGERKRWVARPDHQLFTDRPDIHYNRSTSDDEDFDDQQAMKRVVDVDQDTSTTKTS
ncbi:RNAse P Rpr2/Rpp21/SNM1 subunit domain-containing protein [Chlamydoabsidia padenii]|nr:RNAse P Rpr2/Rpp21/SNM1 subunit domain-containing protein [Chlamydoabsidia padenii]